MKFYKYWTLSKATGRVGNTQIPLRCWGYSNESLEDALRVGEARAQAASELFEKGDHPEHTYYGGDHPFKEAIVEEVTVDDTVLAVLSRNRYGCVILNVPDIFIADLDITKSGGIGAFIARLFGRHVPSFEDKLLDRLDAVCTENPTLGFRLYRTMKGYRAFMTNGLLATDDARSQELLEALGSDKLYMTLCKRQSCYRARLTPKPWRCGARQPRDTFPYMTPAKEASHRRWKQDYTEHIKDYATCSLIGQFGSETTHPKVEQMIALHDRYTLNGETPLA